MDNHRRQEDIGYGGRVDLSELDHGEALIMIELKRQRAPRDAAAQALNHATWAESLESENITCIYTRFTDESDLGQASRDRFDRVHLEDQLNQSYTDRRIEVFKHNEQTVNCTHILMSE